MWSSISSLPYSKSNVRHEETVLVSSMLFQVWDRLAQVHSLDQSTIRVIQDPIRCFLNRDPQTDGKNGLVPYGPFNFQAHSFCQVKILLFKMNSSGLFEVKSQPIRWRSNSHSTFLSALCQGDKQTMYSKFLNGCQLQCVLLLTCRHVISRACGISPSLSLAER